MEPETNGKDRSTETIETPTPDVVEVKVEVKEEASKATPAPASKSTTGGRKRNHDRGRDRSRDRQSERERQRRGERSRGGGGDRGSKGAVYQPRSHPECRVYISNIPYEHRWQDLKDLLRNEVGEVSFVELFEDENGKPRGCGIVEFEKREHALTALDKMNGFELKGRRLVVKEDLDVERDRTGRLIRAGGSGGGRRDNPRDGFRSPLPPSRDFRDDNGRNGGGRGGMSSSGPGLGTLASRSSTRWHDTYGLSPEFLESLGISGPLCRRVFIANLDYKVDDAKLREVFRLAGQLVNAEVTKDRDGRSRGFGVAEFEHPVESVQAISMFNNQMLFDRRMTVRMDRDAERLETRGPSSSTGLPAGLRSIGMGLGAGGNPIHDVHRAPPRSLSPDHRDLMQSSMSYGSRGLSSASDRDMGILPIPSTRSLYGSAPLPSSGLSSSNNGSSSLMMDYGSRGSNSYSYSSGLGGSTNGSNGSSVGALMSSNASYGYSTDSLMSRGSNVATLSDYDRRDNYDRDSYQSSNQQVREVREVRERQPEYRSTSSAYDLGTRMAPISASSASALMDQIGGSHNRITDTIVISNLPLNCSWQDLRDKFCEVGDVLFADIRSKGTGLVRFSSDRDAQRAVSLLHRSRMEGQTIDVEFY